MNTKLVSAIAAALGLAAAGTVSADIGKVGVYGDVNLSFNLDNPENSNNHEYELHSNSSHVGIWAEAGSEDLGAFVLIEFENNSSDGGFNAAAAGSTAEKYNQVVGFKGSFGSVFFGNHNTPTRVLGEVVDQFDEYHLADIGNLNQNGRTNFGDTRQGSSWNYRGAFAGLGVWVQLNQDAGSQQTSNDDDEYPVDDINLSVTYQTGGLTLGAAIEADNSTDRTASRWVASYEQKNAFSVGLLTQITAGSTSTSDTTFGVVLSGSINLDDANKIKAQIGVVPEREKDSTVYQTGNRLAALGWEHQASKNVKFYAYTAADNDNTDDDAKNVETTVGAGFEVSFGKKAKGLY